jgi:hypothetical protein
MPMIRHLALILALVLVLAGCTVPSGSSLSDEQRCGRYGGIWQMGVCKTTG